MYALFIQLNLFYTEKKKLIHDVTAEVYFYKKNILASANVIELF